MKIASLLVAMPLIFCSCASTSFNRQVKNGHICEATYFEVYSVLQQTAQRFSAAYDLLVREQPDERYHRTDLLIDGTRHFPKEHRDMLAPLLWRGANDSDAQVRRTAIRISLDWHGQWPTNGLDLPDAYFDPTNHPSLMKQMEIENRNESRD